MTVSVHQLHNKVRLVQLHIHDGTVMGYDAAISPRMRYYFNETVLLHYRPSDQLNTVNYSHVRQGAGNTIILDLS